MLWMGPCSWGVLGLKAHLSQGKCAASGVEDYSYIRCEDTEAWRWSNSPLGLQGEALGFELRKFGFEDSRRFRCFKAFTFVDHIDDWLAFNKWFTFSGLSLLIWTMRMYPGWAGGQLNASSLILLTIRDFSWVEGFWSHSFNSSIL